jgi:hypothetical protein
VDGRAKWDRTAGLQGQLQPSGLGARAQYEATSPWVILPKGESRRNSQRDYDNQDMVMRVNSSNKNQLSNIAPISQLTNSSYHGTRRMSIKHEQSSKPNSQRSRRHTATATATGRPDLLSGHQWKQPPRSADKCERPLLLLRHTETSWTYFVRTYYLSLRRDATTIGEVYILPRMLLG